MRKNFIFILAFLLSSGLSMAQIQKAKLPAKYTPSFAKQIQTNEHLGSLTSKTLTAWALPSDGSTSGNTRAPGNTYKYQRTEYLITAAEMAASGFPSGNTIDGIGFLIATAGATAQTGAFTVYLKNTTDVTYTLGATWTTAGFTTVSSIPSWTVPIAVGSYVVPFSGGSTFTYTGGGVYVAWEFANTGTAGTTALIASCNTALTGGLYGYRGTTSSTTLTVSNYRPATQFVNNSIVDIAAITNIYTLEKVAVGYGTPTPINVRVANNSASAATFNVTLTVKDPTNTITRFTSTQAVTALAANSSSILTFTGWTPTILENCNISATTSTIPTETWVTNNTKTIQSAVNNTTLGYSFTTTGSAGFGYTTPGTGLFLSKFTMSGTGSVTGANIVISTDAASAGDTVYAVVLNSAGTIMAQSANYIILAGDLGLNKSFTFSPAPSFSSEVYYVGMAQTKGVGQWYPLGTFNEIPQRAATFYTAAITGGTLTELPITFNMKYGIEAVVGTPPATDGGVSAITSPVSSCTTLSSSENIVVTIKNYGTSALTGFPVSYKINNNTPVTVTYTGSIAGGATATYTFTGANAANLSVPGNYRIKAYTGVTGDATHTNDTSTVYIYSGAATVPYAMGFETTDDLSGWTILDANTDTFFWDIYSGVKYAHSGTQFAAYIYNSDGVTAADDWLFTKCINLVSGNTYQLKFYYRAMMNVYPEAMNVKIGTTNNVAGMTTQLVDLPSITDTTYPSSITQFTVPSTGNYYIGFHCKSLANEDILILDDITIDMVTGVSANENPQDISIYPNPASTMVTVVAPERVTHLKVLDLLGNVVHEEDGLQNIVTLNTSNYSKGIYFVVVTTEKQTFTRKIQIIK